MLQAGLTTGAAKLSFQLSQGELYASAPIPLTTNLDVALAQTRRGFCHNASMTARSWDRYTRYRLNPPVRIRTQVRDFQNQTAALHLLRWVGSALGEEGTVNVR
jgi:hypothetical protein